MYPHNNSNGNNPQTFNIHPQYSPTQTQGNVPKQNQFQMTSLSSQQPNHKCHSNMCSMQMMPPGQLGMIQPIAMSMPPQSMQMPPPQSMQMSQQDNMQISMPRSTNFLPYPNNNGVPMQFQMLRNNNNGISGSMPMTNLTQQYQMSQQMNAMPTQMYPTMFMDNGYPLPTNGSYYDQSNIIDQSYFMDQMPEDALKNKSKTNSSTKKK